MSVRLCPFPARLFPKVNVNMDVDKPRRHVQSGHIHTLLRFANGNHGSNAGDLSTRNRNIGHAVCIDTRACGKGWLTCLDVGSGIYWQANQRGQTRGGQLEG